MKGFNIYSTADVGIQETFRAPTRGNSCRCERGSLSLGSSYLGFALRGEVLLDEQGAQCHAKVLVGLSEAEAAQLQLLLHAVNLPGELVDGAAEGGGQVLAQRRHDAPQHVVVQNPGDRTFVRICLIIQILYTNKIWYSTISTRNKNCIKLRIKASGKIKLTLKSLDVLDFSLDLKLTKDVDVFAKWTFNSKVMNFSKENWLCVTLRAFNLMARLVLWEWTSENEFNVNNSLKYLEKMWRVQHFYLNMQDWRVLMAHTGSKHLDRIPFI